MATKSRSRMMLAASSTKINRPPFVIARLVCNAASLENRPCSMARANRADSASCAKPPDDPAQPLGHPLEHGPEVSLSRGYPGLLTLPAPSAPLLAV